MKTNTYSLIHSPWLLSEAAAQSMMPLLLNMIKGVPAEKRDADIIASYVRADGDYCDGGAYTSMEENGRYIGVLSIIGTIYKYDQECGPVGTKTMLETLKEWASNESVLGVVVNMDSGGGQGEGTRDLFSYLKTYPKPVETYVDSNAGSAAYWIASGTQRITVNPFAFGVGSIGTMAKYVNLDGILTEQGAEIREIYPPESPRKNEESRALKDGDNSVLIKNVLTPWANNFKDDVLSVRPNVNPEVFQGAYYGPDDALRLGLVDALGSIDDVFNSIISKSSNNNNMSKQRARVQAVLGLSAPLAETAERGSYLNAEQLDALETAIEASATSVADLTAQVSTANTAQTTAETALTEAKTAHTARITALTESINTVATAAGLTPSASLEETITALNAKVLVMGGKDGDAPTSVKIDPAAPAAAVDPASWGVDFAALKNS